MAKREKKLGAEQDVECITFCEKQKGKNIYWFVLVFA